MHALSTGCGGSGVGRSHHRQSPSPRPREPASGWQRRTRRPCRGTPCSKTSPAPAFFRWPRRLPRWRHPPHPRDFRNLWLQPWDGEWSAKAKVRLEVENLVCAGRVSLETAQEAIRGNWRAAYRRYVGVAVAISARVSVWPCRVPSRVHCAGQCPPWNGHGNADARGSDDGERLTLGQRRPGQPRVLGCNGHDGLPVAAAQRDVLRAARCSSRSAMFFAQRLTLSSLAPAALSTARAP